MKSPVMDDNGLLMMSRAGKTRRPNAVNRTTWIVLLALGFTASAQGQNEAAAKSERLDTILVDMDGNTQRVVVPRNKSVIINTTHPYQRVQAVVPDVAIVEEVGPKQMLVIGLSPGETQLLIWADMAEDKQKILEIEVSIDVAGLEEAIKAVAPNSDVKAKAVGGNVILTGTVNDPGAAALINDVVHNYFRPNQAGGVVRIINRIQVTPMANQLRIPDVLSNMKEPDPEPKPDRQAEQTPEHVLKELEQALHKIDPGSEVEISVVGTNLVLTGTVADTLASTRMEEITELYLSVFAHGEPGVVLNHLRTQLMREDTGRQDQSAQRVMDSLRQSLQKIDPQSSMEVVSVGPNLVLTGNVSDGYAAEQMLRIAELFLPAFSQAARDGADTGGTGEVVNHLRVTGEQQVLLKVVVAELNRSAARSLGVNGFLAGEDFRDAFAVNQIGGINPINIGAAADVDVTGQIPFLTGTEGVPLAPGATLSLGFPRAGIQTFIEALADNSLLRILAEPNLVAVSGETASFLAGGEFPIPVPQDQDTITIEFREFGVRLNFEPVVLGNQNIRLRIAPEVSTTDFSAAVQIGGFAVPGLTSRRAETTVIVGSGQTLAIAGLLDDQIRGFASQVPGLGKIPVLGSLFRSVEYRRNQTELVIMVTPELVAPMNPDQIHFAAGREVTEPSDFELYGMGKLEGKPRKMKRAPIGGVEDDERYGHQPVSSMSGANRHRNANSRQFGLQGPWGFADSKDLN
jgi:pilus assembly protein CpaC